METWIWQIGSGYFGCRDENGNFDPDKFKITANLDQVKMIEIKLSFKVPNLVTGVFYLKKNF